MDIEITFVNHSFDANNSSIVIFQKNVASDFEEIAIAWRVIKNCGRNWTHTFKYPMGFQIGARDSWGNVSDLQDGIYGQKWDVVRSTSGDVLELDNTPSASPHHVEIKNTLPVGSIDGQIYKDGKLLACKHGVSPQQKAVFSFKPTLWVGVVSQVEEGHVLNSAILSDINTEISLLGILKADLVMTGGGTGPDAQPFQFNLIPRS